MTQIQTISHEFTTIIPDDLMDNILYISMEYATAIHKCCCGCQNKVVTPFSPNDWKFIYNGQTITLYPSIGNWNFSCRSHYWIRDSKIEWAQSKIVTRSNTEIEQIKIKRNIKKKGLFKIMSNFLHR
jgi:hypothetical protein